MLEQRDRKLGDGAQRWVEFPRTKQHAYGQPRIQGVQTVSRETRHHVDAEVARVAIGEDHEPLARIVALRQLSTDCQRRCASNDSYRLAINRKRPGLPGRLGPNTNYAATSIARPLPLLADDRLER